MPDRRARLWARVQDLAGHRPVGVAHVGEVLVCATGVDGAAVSLWADASRGELVWASDDLAARLADLAATLGEGPVADTRAGGGPILVPDLADAVWQRRWPGFVPAAAALVVRVVAALPLQVGAIRLGVLMLHRRTPGHLDGDRLADTLVLADAVVLLILDGVDDGRRVPRAAAAAWVPPGTWSPRVHQATGMVVVQLGIGADEAFTRLRAYAYAHGRRLGDVADDVVAGRLRFHPDGPDDDTGEGPATCTGRGPVA